MEKIMKQVASEKNKMSQKTVILIPARMASTRLPGKPLADIAGLPMIVQVWRRAQESGVGDVVVACDHGDIVQAIEAAGGRAILTDPQLPSGSDRIWAALQTLGQSYDLIVNVQGDLPTLDPQLIQAAVGVMDDPQVDIATLVCPIRVADERTSPHVVKAVLSFGAHENQGRALYFSRAPVPHGAKTLYHHIGLYVYRQESLRRFVSLPPSPLELAEKLEQLRALEAGMRIDAAVVETVPLGVDTPEDLERARAFLRGDL